MAKKHANVSFIESTPFDNLFGGIENTPTQKEVEIIESSEGSEKDIHVSELFEERNHSFKVLDDESMERLKDSIKENGIIYPLLVRQVGNKYEVLSGHRRLHAAKAISLEVVPCKVLDVDDATADIIMVDTNLHREEILPSEKAKSYDIRIKAMKAKGLLDSDAERNYEEMLAKDVNSSRVNVYRYRKLLLLHPELMDMVDRKDIPVNAGAKIAVLPEETQEAILEVLKESGKPLTIEKAIKISETKNPTKEKIQTIIEDKKKLLYKAAREKNFYNAYPDAIKLLTSKEKELFIKDCIDEYVKTHVSWKGSKLK